MKKISFYLSIALAGLFSTACTDDYNDWAAPQSNPQERAITIAGLTASAAAESAIDLAAADTVKLLTIDYSALPAGAKADKLRIVASPEGVDGEPVTIEALDANGNFAKADLQEVVTTFYGRRPTARTLNCHAYLAAMINGQACYVDAGEFQVQITPVAPQISNTYYIVGGTKDWAESAASKEQKFSHSDKDVYDDPVFTIVIDAGDGDTWFAIGDDEACDAITNEGNWSKLFGTTAGNGNSGAEGKLDRRSNLSDEGSFKVEAGAKKIKVTINMMDYTYKVEAVNIAENYYIVGGTLDWGESARTKAQKFSHSDKDVFEDPYFSIIIPANAGGETWFAIGDDEACDAIANDNNWSLLYGNTDGNGQNCATGTMARRSALSDEGSFKWASSAAMIKVVINMLDLSFEISDVAPQYFMVGALPGWSADGAKTALFYPTSASQMTYTSVFGEGNNLKIWNKNDLGNWDKAYGSVVDNATDATGALVGSGAGAISVPGAGIYTLSLDLVAMTYTWTLLDNQSPAEYETIGVVGGFCNWANDGATDLDMTQVTPHNWYVETEIAEDTELKFRANDGWDVNWGAELSVDEGNFYATGLGGGDNIQVPAGKYDFYLNDITGQFAIVKK